MFDSITALSCANMTPVVSLVIRMSFVYLHNHVQLYSTISKYGVTSLTLQRIGFSLLQNFCRLFALLIQVVLVIFLMSQFHLIYNIHLQLFYTSPNSRRRIFLGNSKNFPFSANPLFELIFAVIVAVMYPCSVHSNKLTTKVRSASVKQLQIVITPRHRISYLVNCEQRRHSSY